MRDVARFLLRPVAHVGAVGFVAFCLLLPRSRYDWVRDVAPEIDPSSFHDNGDRTLVVIVFAALVVLFEVVAILTARNAKERRVAIALLGAALLAGLWRVLT